MSTVAIAEGGKNREANPVIVDEDCIYLVPDQINLKDCIEEPTNTFDGYACLINVTAVCDSED